MPKDPRSVAATYFEAWRAGDFGTLRSTLADKGIFRGPLGTAEDADTYLQAMRGTAEMMTDIVIRRVWAEDSDVLTWFDLHTAIASPCATASWMKIADGRVAECSVLFDPRDILAAANAGHEQ